MQSFREDNKIQDGSGIEFNVLLLYICILYPFSYTEVPGGYVLYSSDRYYLKYKLMFKIKLKYRSKASIF